MIKQLALLAITTGVSLVALLQWEDNSQRNRVALQAQAAAARAREMSHAAGAQGEHRAFKTPAPWWEAVKRKIDSVIYSE
jgi:hypothetical protein